MKRGLNVFSIVLLGCSVFLITFWSIPLPKNLQFAIANRYPTFYFHHPTTENYAHTERLLLQSLTFKMGYDWQKRTVANIENEKLPFKEAISHIQSIFLSQKEAPIDVFATQTYASTLRGFGTCDQMNGSLALLLNGFYSHCELVELKTPSLGSHSVVRCTTPYGLVYADAFSEEGFYAFPEDLTALGVAIPVYQENKNLYPTSAYANARVIKNYNPLKRIYSSMLVNPLLVVKWAIKMTFYKKHYTQNHSLLRMYLKARITHLHGDLEGARILYKKVAQANEKQLSEFARLFLQKLP